MDHDTKSEVRRLIREGIKEHITHDEYRVCPSCKVHTSFLKFYIDDPKKKDYPFQPDRLRCMNCLAVSIEELKAVE